MTVGQIAELADAPTVSSEDDLDVARMSFKDIEQVANKGLKVFLSEHAKSLPA